MWAIKGRRTMYSFETRFQKRMFHQGRETAGEARAGLPLTQSPSNTCKEMPSRYIRIDAFLSPKIDKIKEKSMYPMSGS